MLDQLTGKCLSLLENERTKSSLELFWVLFALSCVPRQHELMAENAESLIHALMEVTYKYIQKV